MDDIYIFDVLKNANHSMYMDNHYILVTFGRNARNSKNKVKLDGVTETDNRSIRKISGQT